MDWDWVWSWLKWILICLFSGCSQRWLDIILENSPSHTSQWSMADLVLVLLIHPVSFLWSKCPGVNKTCLKLQNVLFFSSVTNSTIKSKKLTGTDSKEWDLKGIYMRPGRTQTSMNLYRYKMFAAVYMKPAKDAWCLVLGWNDRLEISGPILRFAVIYMRPVWEFQAGLV